MRKHGLWAPMAILIAMLLAAVFALPLTAAPGYAQSPKPGPWLQLPNRQLDVAFAFCLTGDASAAESGKAMESASRLLDVLLAHEGLKFSVGISATLASGLTWAGGQAIRQLRDGLSRGQFELLGASFAEGVLPAMDPWDAQLAVALGSHAAMDLFGEAPTGFWNPSLVWRQEIIHLLSSAGYTHTLAPDWRLSSGTLGVLPPNAPVRTGWSGREITVFQADEAFARAVDESIRTGSPAAAMDYLASAYARDTRDASVVVYAREICVGSDQTQWGGLDALLTAVEAEPWVSVSTLSGLMESGITLPAVASIPAAEPASVRAAVKAAGFSDWQTYVSSSPQIASIRKLQGEVRSRIQAVEADIRKAGAGAVQTGPEAASAAALLDQAKLLYAFSQYGFGRPPTKGESSSSGGSASSEAALRAAYAPAMAAWQSLHPAESVYREDVDRDGVDEAVIVNSADMFIVSPFGGRLLYWYDLEHGEEIVGVGNNRPGALRDWLSGPGSLASKNYDVELGTGSATFSWNEGGCELRKRLTPVEGGFTIDYSLRARGKVEFAVESSFSPGFPVLTQAGRDCIVYYQSGFAASSLTAGGRFGLLNALSGTVVQVEPSPGIPARGRPGVPPPSWVSSDSGLFTRGLSMGYRIFMASRASASISIKYTRSRVHPEAPPALWIERRGPEIAAGLPSYTRNCILRELVGGFTVDTPMMSTGSAGGYGEVKAPMPNGRFDMVTSAVTGRRAVVNNAGAVLSDGNRHEFFPAISDSRVELAGGYTTVGRRLLPWALGGAAAVAITAGLLVIATRHRKKQKRGPA
ncbi:MAG: hypothetical protein VB144_02960 [Clostridia bacterium]|nr:hypothetical protein [Clostridia bacterium]